LTKSDAAKYRSARSRHFFSIVVGIVAGGLASIWFDWRTAVIAAWDAASFCLLLISWILLARESAAQTRRRAAAEDPGRQLLRLITVGSCVATLFAALAALSKAESLWITHQLLVVLSLFAAVSSWLLMHTSYALHYAHLFYRGGEHATALAFPACEEPEGFDFAYFSFTIGMCYQTSDVSVQTRSTRRAVLGHALLSFVFNTAILALTVNMLLGSLGD